MMGSQNKITSQHLERMAIVYVRQSSLAQVRENRESTARQYGLADEAIRLGWDPCLIQVIDADQGVSGRSADARKGFQELVRRVCLGEAGAVFGLEISRLARSSADLQRLLEFCSLTGTLIVDADGVYDLQNFNDRLLLGLKGTMSEAELHILAGRLQESKRAAAKRGELRSPLPVGYVYDADGRTVMDPSDEIRAAVAGVFSAFEVVGSAYGVVGTFKDRPFPRRAYGGAWSGEVRWGRLTHSRVVQILSNPSYAGAYTYGRYHSQRRVNPDGSLKTKIGKRSRQDWPVLLKNHHPAYVTWETYLANEQRLAANDNRRGARPPREGAALLQGIVRCGSCGRAMSTDHPYGRPTYDCCHARADHIQTPGCRSVMAETVDLAVAKRVLAVISTDEIRLALAAADEVKARDASRSRVFEMQLERARYEAGRAERAFNACEPENRLVARTLEQRWEEKLHVLAEAESAWVTAQADKAPLASRDELEALAEDFPRLWAASSTSFKDRKRILRALIADVTLLSRQDPEEGIRVGIHWRSGATEELLVARPVRYSRTARGATDLVHLLSDRSADEIAVELNAKGLKTGKGRPFNAQAVRWLRHAHRIPPPKPHFGPGELAVADVAAQLGISSVTVYDWIEKKHLDAQRGPDGRLRVAFSAEVLQACQQRVANSHHLKPQNRKRTVGEAV
jgi:DNA invertase Pin-like site-specific DNA recombinase